MAALHRRGACSMLALTNDVTQFETRHAAFVRAAPGPAHAAACPPASTPCAGASSASRSMSNSPPALRRDMIVLAGEKIGDMRAHPTPQRRRRYRCAGAGGAALFPLQGALSDRCGAAVAGRRAGYRRAGRGLGHGGGKGADRPARHRHLDGALCADARRLCRCGAGGRQRPGDRPCSGCTSCRNGPMPTRPPADGRLRAPSQPRHHASVDLPEGEGAA